MARASLLFTIVHATDEPERAGGALVAALAAAEAGHDVALWLANEGVRLAVRGVAETLREPYAPDAAAAMDALAARGVRFHADRAAFERRSFDPDQLRPGAVLAESADLARLVGDGRATVHV